MSALLLGLAAWQTVVAVLPAAPVSGVPTVVLARDRPAGTVLGADDLSVEPRPEEQRPRGAVARVADAMGRVLSGPVLAGEVLTTARFQGSALLAGLPSGSVAVSLPVPDPFLAAALRPGDVVSVLVAGSGQTVVPSAVVLQGRTEDSGGLGSGGLDPGGLGSGGLGSGGLGSGGLGSGAGMPARLLVAVTSEEARAVAAATGPAGSGAEFLLAVRR